MMTIEFVFFGRVVHQDGFGRDHYTCNSADKDCSGRWVKAEVAESLLARLKKVSSSLENMIDCACDDDCRPGAVHQLEIAQKIIKQAEEEV